MLKFFTKFSMNYSFTMILTRLEIIPSVCSFVDLYIDEATKTMSIDFCTLKEAINKPKTKKTVEFKPKVIPIGIGSIYFLFFSFHRYSSVESTSIQAVSNMRKVKKLIKQGYTLI